MDPIIMESYGDEAQDQLRNKGFTHLQVVKRGKHLVIVSQEADGQRVNRARLTWAHGRTFELGLADHRGKWESAGYEGSVSELIAILMEQFSFALTQW